MKKKFDFSLFLSLLALLKKEFKTINIPDQFQFEITNKNRSSKNKRNSPLLTRSCNIGNLTTGSLSFRNKLDRTKKLFF